VTPGSQFCPSCGNDVSGPLGNSRTVEVPPGTPSPHESGTALLELLREATLGHYDVIGELGRGGMAIVYLAHDIMLNQKVAIKVMNPGLLLGMGKGASERFKREARTAAALSHQNIIPIYMARETEKLVFFVMKYIEGRSLDSILAESGALPIKMVLTILSQVGAALGYAHRRGVVHRDVKPANILIDTEGSVVVTDFGIAKVAEAGTLTESGATVGTPSYMSPEQCSAQPVTGASDQYSVGIVAFEMLTGRPPFTGDSLMDIMRQHFFETPSAVTVVRPDCPPRLATTIDRMLAKEPGRRWPSIEDAIDAAGIEPLRRDDPTRAELMKLASTGIRPVARLSTPVSPVPVDRPKVPKAVAPMVGAPSPQLPSARRKTIAWVTVGLATAAAAFGVYRFTRSDQTPDRPAAISRAAPDTLPVSEPPQPQTPAVQPPSAADSPSVARRSTIPVTAPAPAVLNIVVVPSWAVLFVDGNRAGQNNHFRLPLTARVFHRLRFERPGYATLDTVVMLQPGASFDRTIAMGPVSPGILQLRIQPWANVSIDGAPVGQKSLRVDTLSAELPHRLRFERDGWVTKDTVVTLRPGETVQRMIELQRREP
jgi:serine/threonine-protein kinase